jgi:hypothetical protein
VRWIPKGVRDVGRFEFYLSFTKIDLERMVLVLIVNNVFVKEQIGRIQLKGKLEKSVIEDFINIAINIGKMFYLMVKYIEKRIRNILRNIVLLRSLKKVFVGATKREWSLVNNMNILR